MNNPCISIITPSFNRGHMIEDTIRSVMRQTYRNFEYHVVDGASTDDTLVILQRYASETNFAFVSEPDDGMYDAINKGFQGCRGDILGYLNSDDLYFPWTLERVACFFREHPGIDLVLGDALVHEIEKNDYRPNMYPGFKRNWLFGGAIIAQPTVFFRRSVFENVGPFARNVKYLGDCEYWLRALAKGFRMAKIHEFLAIEKNHCTTLRNRFRDQIEAEKEMLLKRYARSLYRHDPTRRLLLRIKYIEKEMLTLWFALKTSFSIRGGRWDRIITSYDIEFHFGGYLGSKLRMKDLSAWSMKPTQPDRIPG